MTLYNRGYSYYAILRVSRNACHPSGKKQVWISLRTTDKKIAQQRYIVVASKILNQELSKHQKREKMGYNKDDNTLDFDRQQAEIFAYEWLLNAINEEKSKQAGKVLTSEPYMQQFAMLRSKYSLADYSDMEKTVSLFLLRNGYPFPSEETADILFEAFMRAVLQFCSFMAKMAAGETQNFPERLLSGVPAAITFGSYASGITTTTAKPLKPDLTLVQLAETYNNLESRKNATKDSQERILAKTRVWQELLGKEKTIRTLTSDDLQKAVAELPFITKGFARTHQGNYNVFHDIAEGRKHPSKRISSKTLGEYISIVKKLLSWAVRFKYLQENPFDCVDVPVAKNDDEGVKRLPFTLNQLNAIFHAPIYTGCRDDKSGYSIVGEAHPRRARFWVPLLGLFTGARCNELCQLLPSDIHQTEGVWVISINDEGDKHVKTKAGIREIPVHPELIKMGFLDYVRQMRREKRLFPELKPNARGAYSDEMSRWFGRFLETVNRTLKAKDRMGQGHVFHSFRHTFRTELRNNDASNEHVLRLGGWERGSSLADHYGTISMKVLEKTMIEKVRYDGLDLSHLYA